MKSKRINRKIGASGLGRKRRWGEAHGAAVLLAALIVFAASAVAAFAGTVSYEGEAKGFVFSPGSSTSPTDLFSGFKDVVPGDSLTETIDVKNNSSDEVKIYMRALDSDSGKNDFLSKLSLSVVNKGSDKIFDAAADQKAGLSDWVLLGTLASGGSTTLDVTVGVPIDMGNEYQDAAGTVNWQFMVEVPDEVKETTPRKDPDSSNPDDPKKDTPIPSKDDGDGDDGGSGGGSGVKTGDSRRLFAWCAIGLVAAAAGGAIGIRRRRSE